MSNLYVNDEHIEERAFDSDKTNDAESSLLNIDAKNEYEQPTPRKGHYYENAEEFVLVDDDEEDGKGNSYENDEEFTLSDDDEKKNALELIGPHYTQLETGDFTGDEIVSNMDMTAVQGNTHLHTLRAPTMLRSSSVHESSTITNPRAVITRMARSHSDPTQDRHKAMVPLLNFYHPDAWDESIISLIQQLYNEHPVTAHSASANLTKQGVLEERKEARMKVRDDILNLDTNWNERYQTLCDTPITTQEEMHAKTTQLNELIDAFVTYAQTVCEIIAKESNQNLPPIDRIFPPADLGGIAGGTKFRVGHVLFKFTRLQPHSVLYSCEMHAMKAANNELTGMNAILSCKIHALHTTLSALFHIRGYSIFATAWAPIEGRKTLVYGSDDGGLSLHNTSPEFSVLLDGVGTQLHLATHSIETTSDIVKTCVAGDVEGHLSSQDGRYYVVDLGRLLPPTLPHNGTKEFWFNSFRPEFMHKYCQLSVSSDIYTPWGKKDKEVHNAVGIAAFRMFQNEQWPALALSLQQDMMFVLWQDQPTLPDFATVFHQAGVNMRYLSAVRDLVTIPTVRQALLAEMVARCVKIRSRKVLRQQTFAAQTPYLFAIRRQLLVLLGQGKAADYYWERVLMTDLTSKFHLRNQTNKDVFGVLRHDLADLRTQLAIESMKIDRKRGNVTPLITRFLRALTLHHSRLHSVHQRVNHDSNNNNKNNKNDNNNGVRFYSPVTMELNHIRAEQMRILLTDLDRVEPAVLSLVSEVSPLVRVKVVKKPPFFSNTNSDQAKQQYIADLELQEKSLGPKHHALLPTLYDLLQVTMIKAFTESGMQELTEERSLLFIEGLNWVQRILDIHNNENTPRTPASVRCVTVVAEFYSEFHRLEEALQFAREGLKLARVLIANEHPEFVALRKRVVDLLEAVQTKGRVRMFPLRDLRPAFKALRGLQTVQDVKRAQASRWTEMEDNKGDIESEIREVWAHLGFLGQFADAYLANTELDVCSKGKNDNMAKACKFLDDIITQISSVKRDWLSLYSDEDIKKIDTVSVILKNGQELGKQMARMQNSHDLHWLLYCFRQHLAQLPPGEIMLIPGGWTTPSKNHGLMYMLERRSGVDKNFFNFFVVNAGEGIQYHRSSGHASPKMKYETTIRLDRIPQERVMDDALWYFLFKIQGTKAEEHRLEVLYEILLPHLTNGEPLASAIARSGAAADPGIVFSTPQRAQICFFRSVLEALKYLLRRVGLSSEQLKQMTFCIRRSMLDMALVDLGQLRRPFLTESDIYLIRIAAKQTSRCAVKEMQAKRLSTENLTHVYQLVHNLEQAIKKRTKQEVSLPLLALETKTSLLDFPNFELLAKEPNVKMLSPFWGMATRIGTASLIDFSVLHARIRITSFWDVVHAITVCLKLCNEQEYASDTSSLNGTYYQRLALITDLVTNSLPLPLPQTALLQQDTLSDVDTRTFRLYRLAKVTRVEQLQILREIQALLGHLTACMKSVPMTSTLRGTSTVVLAGLMTVFDTVLRLHATDNASCVAMVLNGSARLKECIGMDESKQHPLPIYKVKEESEAEAKVYAQMLAASAPTEMKQSDTDKAPGPLPAEVTPAAVSWECHVCTFQNGAMDSACVMCSTSKPVVSTSGLEVKNTAAAQEWNCTVCTFLNQASATACVTCGEIRAKNAMKLITWVCEMCTAENKPDARACSVCGRHKPSTKGQDDHEPPALSHAFYINLDDGGGFPLARVLDNVLISSPELAMTRCAALEYVHGQTSSRTARSVFQFNCLQEDINTTRVIKKEGTVSFLRKLCSLIHLDLLPPKEDQMDDQESFLQAAVKALTQPDSMLLTCMPELAIMRDVTMLYKIAMSHTLPEQEYSSKDTRLTWMEPASRGSAESVFMKCVGFRLIDVDEKALSVRSRRIVTCSDPKELFMIDFAPRKTTTNNNNGKITKDLLQMQQLRDTVISDDPSEDDILLCKKLPSFGGLLSQEDSERLLVALTAPYLRIQMALAFFSTKERISALVNPTLQSVLTSCLFEPGTFNSRLQHIVLDQIPSQDPVGCPHGNLLEHLMHDPASILASVVVLTNLALQLNTGSYQSSSAPVILFLVTLLTRIEANILHILRQEVIATNSQVVHILAEYRQELRVLFDDKLFTLLQEWCDEAGEQDDLKNACLLQAHMFLMIEHRGYTLDEDMKAVGHVSVLDTFNVIDTTLFLSKLAFLTSWHAPQSHVPVAKGQEPAAQVDKKQRDGGNGQRELEGKTATVVDKDAKANADADEEEWCCVDPDDECEEDAYAAEVQVSKIAEQEKKQREKTQKAKQLAMAAIPLSSVFLDDVSVFKVVQVTRRRVLKVLGELVAKGKQDDIDNILQAALTSALRDPLLIARGWKPDVAKMAPGQEGLFLNVQGDVTINVQTGELFFSRGHIRPVPTSMSRVSDFSAVLGLRSRHCCIESTHANMMSVRLVGAEVGDVDVQLYKQLPLEPTDADFFKKPPLQCPTPLAGRSHVYTCFQCNNPADRTKPYCNNCERKTPQYPDGWLFNQCSYQTVFHENQFTPATRWVFDPVWQLLLSKYRKPEKIPFELFIANPAHISNEDNAVHILALHSSTFKEFVVYKNRGVVEMYVLIEHGRIMQRSLKYSSNARFCLRDLRLNDGDVKRAPAPEHVHQAGNPQSSFVTYDASVLLTRVIHSTDSFTEIKEEDLTRTERYIPKRLLYGLLPDVLLQNFKFWRQSDSTWIRGVRDLKNSAHSASLFMYQVLLELITLPNGHVTCRITRLPLDTSDGEMRNHFLRKRDVKTNGFASPPATLHRSYSSAESAQMDEQHLTMCQRLAEDVFMGQANGLRENTQFELLFLQTIRDLILNGAGPDVILSYVAIREQFVRDTIEFGVSCAQSFLQAALPLDNHRVRVEWIERAAAEAQQSATELKLSERDDLSEEKDPTEPFESKLDHEDTKQPVPSIVEMNDFTSAWRLVNITQAAPESALGRIATVLSRIENMSYVLCWCSVSEGDVSLGDVELIELPRLKLAFEPRTHSDGTIRLYSVDHSHLYISDTYTDGVKALMRGIPHSLLLVNHVQEAFILVPSHPVVRPLVSAEPFGTQVVCHRGDRTWAKLMHPSFFLYPVHITHTHVSTPTQVSALYLVLLRMMSHDYLSCFRILESIEADKTLTDAEAFMLQMIGSHSSDWTPSAHALRLKLSLCVLHCKEWLPWNLPLEFKAYLSKRALVPAEGVLSDAEELILLRHIDSGDYLLRKNRFLELKEKNQQKNMMASMSMLKKDEQLRNRRKVLLWTKHNMSIRAAPPDNDNNNDEKKTEHTLESKVVERLPQMIPAKQKGTKHIWQYVEERLDELFGSGANMSSAPWDASLTYNATMLRRAKAGECVEHLRVLWKDDITGGSNRGFLFLTELVSQRLHMCLGLGDSAVLGQEDGKDNINNAKTLGSLFTRLYLLKQIEWEEDNVFRLQVHGGYEDGSMVPYLVIALMEHWDTKSAAFPPLPYHDMPQLRHGMDTVRRKTKRQGKKKADNINALADYLQEVLVIGSSIYHHITTSGLYTLKRYAIPNITAVSLQQQPVKTQLHGSAPTDDVTCNERMMPLLTSDDMIDGVFFTQQDVADFSGLILNPIGLDSFISSEESTTTAKDDLKTATLSQLPFDIRAHKDAQGIGSEAILDRLEADMKIFATQSLAKPIQHFTGLSQQNMNALNSTDVGEQLSMLTAASMQLDLLIEKLEMLREVDAKQLPKLFECIHVMLSEETVMRSDKSGEATEALPAEYQQHLKYLYLLERYAGTRVKPVLELVLSALLSNDPVRQLHVVQPFLSKRQVSLLVRVSTVLMLRGNRMGHIHRCLAASREIKSVVQHMTVNASERSHQHQQALLLKAELLVTLLCTRRVSVSNRGLFDPKYLLFEYLFNILLRKQQTLLLQGFRSRPNSSSHPDEDVNENGSIVQQMIMGAGKTTVIGPLLALINANGTQLLMQVVPAALLDFSRGVLRQAFATVTRRKVHTFEFDRRIKTEAEAQALYQKLEHARLTKGIVVTTPEAIKSLLLKFLELRTLVTEYVQQISLGKQYDHVQRTDIHEKHRIVLALASILTMWQSAVLVMDEVDLLLHPLRSELNFPIGPKKPLAMSPDRWRLAMWICDIVLQMSRHDDTEMSNMTTAHDTSTSSSLKATKLRRAMHAVVVKGVKEHSLQASPHLVLLDYAFYHSEMKGIVADWVMLWLKDQNYTHYLDVYALKCFLCGDPLSQTKKQAFIDAHSTDQLKMLRLARDWVTSFAPHVLSKINRVTYGMLTEDDIAAGDPRMPFSRTLVAIPFVGKDVPSGAAEFAHPDVLVGLTVLAYRYEGMRMRDVRRIVMYLQKEMKEFTGPVHESPAAVKFNHWVALGAALIKQQRRKRESKEDRGEHGDKEEEEEEEEAPFVFNRGLSEGGTTTDLTEASDAKVNFDPENQILPLPLFQAQDPVQIALLFKHFSLLPEAINEYLDSVVLPDVLQFQTTKLSASGQELGGSMLFKTRLGFSGTPSELLPLELGKCHYEVGAEGRILHTLTRADVVSYTELKTWTVESLLIHAANMNPCAHALIDTGALITGLSNLQVAEFLLAHGLKGLEGCVFLDRQDRQQILLRSTGKVVDLAQCGVPLHKRFSFYDQVHTTGMDIKQCIDACAIVTLGKDMTLRDYAQGCYRMRGIGKGQTVHLFLIPEVRALIAAEMALAGETMSNEDGKIQAHVCAWLTVNSLRSEKLQYMQLCIQDLHNIWRKKAFKQLLSHVQAEARSRMTSLPRLDAMGETYVHSFHERVEFDVAATDDGEMPTFLETLENVIAQHATLLNVAQDTVVAANLETVKVMGSGVVTSAPGSVSLEMEMVNEEEQEQQKQKEKMVQQEQQVQVQYQQERTVISYWNITALSQLSLKQMDPAFYQLSDMSVFRQSKLQFPAHALSSVNYFRPSNSSTLLRRLKNVEFLLEIVTGSHMNDDRNISVESTLHPSLVDVVRDVFTLFKQPSNSTAATTEQPATRYDIASCGPLLEQLGMHTVLQALENGATDAVESMCHWLGSLAICGDQVNDKKLASTTTSLSHTRHTMVVSVREAESLLRVLHTGHSMFKHCHVALKSLSGTVLAKSPGYTAGTRCQNIYMQQMYRFLDCQFKYTPREMFMLLRALGGPAENTLYKRQAFLENLLLCRRRENTRWLDSSLTTLFRSSHEVHYLRHLLLLAKLYSNLMRAGIGLADAFERFDADHDGHLSRTELTWALNHVLHMKLSIATIADFVRVADLDENGLIETREFITVFTDLAQSSLVSSWKNDETLVLSPRRGRWNDHIPAMDAEHIAEHEKEMKRITTQSKQRSDAHAAEVIRRTKTQLKRQEEIRHRNAVFVASELERVRGERHMIMMSKQMNRQAGWTCPHCTVMNPRSETICQTCESPRPEEDDDDDLPNHDPQFTRSVSEIDVSDVTFEADPVTGLVFWICPCGQEQRLIVTRCSLCTRQRSQVALSGPVTVEYVACESCHKILEKNQECPVCIHYHSST